MFGWLSNHVICLVDLFLVNFLLSEILSKTLCADFLLGLVKTVLCWNPFLQNFSSHFTFQNIQVLSTIGGWSTGCSACPLPNDPALWPGWATVNALIQPPASPSWPLGTIRLPLSIWTSCKQMSQSSRWTVRGDINPCPSLHSPV